MTSSDCGLGWSVSSNLYKYIEWKIKTEENRYASQNLIRYCQSMGIEKSDITIFTDYKKMNNT